MFKAIATDLDGTLLDSNKKISEYSIKTLEKACKKGIEFIVCTGRMHHSLRNILPVLPFCRFVISSMGAEIYENNKRIYYRPLEKEYADILVDYALKNDIHMNLYINDVLYTNKMDKYAEQYYRDSSSMALEIKGDVKEFFDGKATSKIVYIGEPEDMEKHSAEIEKILGRKVNICASNKRYIECSSLNAQKDLAIKYVLDKLGIGLDELIVFGDSGNDVVMLKNTGFSVCVGNGWDEAKAASDIVVESNDDDGVARTVERLILKEEEL